MTNNTEERNEVERNAGEVTALHDFIAGGVAGSASVIVGHPFDTIKVRLQTSSASSQNAMKASSRNNNYASFLSLFKGMSAPLSAAAAVNAIIFSTYGASTRLVSSASGFLRASCNVILALEIGISLAVVVAKGRGKISSNTVDATMRECTES